MKRIIVLFVLLLGSLISIAQPVTQRGTTAVTVQDARLFAEFNFRPPAFPDTIRANQQIGLDSCGALIYSRDINAYYYRACSPKRWVRVASGGSTADSAYLSYRPLTDSTFLLCRVGGTRCDTIKINGKGVTTAWIVGGNVNPTPPYIGTIDTKEVDVITNNVVRMRVAGNGINRSAAARNKYLMIDTTTRYLFYGDAIDTAYTSSHKINDTTFSLCKNNGRCDTITIGNTVINNFVSTSQTRLISGSAVWDSLMVYSVTNCFYYINGVLYNSSATNVTLDPADSSNPRIDVIYCDTLGNVGVITGIPSPDPVKPVVNPLSQIELTHININAQGTTPSNVSGRIIYNENVGIPNEWNTSTNVPASGVNFAYTTNPYIGTKSALAPQYTSAYSLIFTNDDIVNADTLSELSMYLRLNSPAPLNYNVGINGVLTEAPLFSVFLVNGGVRVSSPINIINGNYGYDRLTELSYQHLAIPFSDFVFFNSSEKTFDQIVFSVATLGMPKLGAQFDYITAVAGGNPPPITGDFWSLNGNDNTSFPNAKLGTTSNDQLSIVTNDIQRVNISNTGIITIPKLQTTTDTTAYKPMSINPDDGQVAMMESWGNNIVYTENPIMSRTSGDSNIIYFNADTANAWRGGGSGAIPTLDQVTTAGNTSYVPININNGGIFNLSLDTFDGINTTKILDYNDIYGTHFSIVDSGGNLASIEAYNNSNNFYKIGFNTYDNKPYINMVNSSTQKLFFSPDYMEFNSNGAGNNVKIIPCNGIYSDTHYFPVADQIDDTLATLRDIRNSGTPGLQEVLTKNNVASSINDYSLTLAENITYDEINVFNAYNLNKPYIKSQLNLNNYDHEPFFNFGVQQGDFFDDYVSINPTLLETKSQSSYKNKILFPYNTNNDYDVSYPISEPSITSDTFAVLRNLRDTAAAIRADIVGSNPNIDQVLSIGNTAINKSQVFENPINSNRIDISNIYVNPLVGRTWIKLWNSSNSFSGIEPEIIYIYNDSSLHNLQIRENKFTFSNGTDSSKIYPRYHNQSDTLPTQSGTLAISVNNVKADSTGNITLTTGSGTVTDISQGYGITVSPTNPITTSGTITVDTSTSGLSGKYLRLTDTSSMFSPYPRGSGAATTMAFWNGSRSLTYNSNIFLDNTNPSSPSFYVSNGTSQRSAMNPTYSGVQYDANNYAYAQTSTSTPFFIAHNGAINKESRLYANKLQFNDLITSGYVNLNAPSSYNNRSYNLPDSSGTIALKEYTIDSLKRSSDSIYARKNGQWNFQYKDSVGGGSGTYVPYTGATTDVDLGTHILNAQSLAAKGTNGNGHLDLRHQASDAPGTGQTTVLFADANGDLKWKNAGNFYTTLKTSGNTADAVYTYPSSTTTLIGAGDTSVFLRKTDSSTYYTKYRSDTSRTNIYNALNGKQASGNYITTSDTSVFQRKSLSAYTFMANNTNSTANATAITYKDSGNQTYNGTITWTGTTQPSGTTSHRYRWSQIGKQVTVTITLIYSVAGSALTAVKLTLPPGCPAPTNFGTLTSANDVLGSSWGYIGTTTSSITTGRTTLNNNAANNGYEFNITSSSTAARTAGFTLTYFTD